RHLQDHGGDFPCRRNDRGQRARQPVRHRPLRAGEAMTAIVTTATAARPTRVPVVLQRVALALLLIAIWWLVSLAVPPYVSPRREGLFTRLGQLSQSGDLPINLLPPLGRVLAGFAIAVVIGVPGGILLGSHRALGTFFEPVLPVLNTVSSAIWAIFALIW